MRSEHGDAKESAFMPTITCSSCGYEVEISMMGEHTCGATSGQRKPIVVKPPYTYFRRLIEIQSYNRNIPGSPISHITWDLNQSMDERRLQSMLELQVSDLRECLSFK